MSTLLTASCVLLDALDGKLKFSDGRSSPSMMMMVVIDDDEGNDDDNLRC